VGEEVAQGYFVENSGFVLREVFFDCVIERE
jgi:hypothetical protein